MYSFQADEIGKRYGRLTVIASAEPRGVRRHRAWRCRCDCGKEIEAAQGNLRGGRQKSCGCLRRELTAAKRSVNLEGQRFGRWKVLSRAACIGRTAAWLCRCDCGHMKAVVTHTLVNGESRSCGCLKRELTSAIFFRDLSGKKFYRLTVLKRAPLIRGSRKRVRWICACDCGGQTVAAIDKLTSGKMKSCGCWHRESFTKHGATSKRNDPRLRSTYHSWQAMKQRCTNPKCPAYSYYGGRGIRYDPQWETFEVFLKDMGMKPSLDHSLDRRKSDGNYTPKNCRWATKKQQAEARRVDISALQDASRKRRRTHLGHFS